MILRGETTLGGGTVLDPAPPRHRDPERLAAVERGEVTIHAPVLVDSLRHVLDDEPAGVERAGPWAFSRAWLAELEHELSARIAQADPIDPGVPPPSEPWAADVLPLLPFELRGAKLYAPGAVASLGAREAEAAELERELATAGLHATKVDDAELARFLEARGALVRLGPEHAVSAAAYESAKDALLDECAVGRRDHARALPRPRRHGTARRAAPARALRPRRAHAPRRRPPRPAPGGAVYGQAVVVMSP